MENGATHYIPSNSEPDRGPYAASSFSSPAPSTLSTGNTAPSTTQSTGMIDTYYLYSHDGKLMAEYDHNGNAVKYYLYMGSRLIAEYQPDTNKYYYMSDQINSTRIVTDENGDVVYSEAYGPYGDIQKTWTKTYDPKLKFSSKEREVYSNLDYFGARYYDSNRYRFISVDPVINKQEALYNPQLWNLYAYCQNNPVTYLDPDGRLPIVLAVPAGGAAIKVAVVGIGIGIAFIVEAMRPKDQTPLEYMGDVSEGMLGSGMATILSEAAESESEKDDTNRKGGGKTGRKINEKRKQSNEDKIAQEQEKLKEAETKKEKTEIKDRIKHLRRKQKKSEEHARTGQR
jgi:RHS repeat-associated protein